MSKKSIFLLIASVVMLSFFTPVFANLLLNPDFEAWTNFRQPSEWTVEDTVYAKIYKESTRVFHGNYAVKMQRFQIGTGNNKGIFQRVAIPGRGRYIASVRFYRNNDSVLGGLTITWRNANAGFISSWPVLYTDTILPSWQVVRKAAITDTAPTGAVYADFIIRTYGRGAPTPSPSGGTLFVDSVSFGAVTAIEEIGNSISANPLNLEVKPNPFSNTARINFSVNPADFGAVKIYDATGNLVRTIRSIGQAGSSYTTTWDGRNERGILSAPGVYFIVLETKQGQSQALKTMFLR
ncbi:MAG: T9SS type A sorting domain-containing protein [Candidatus Latescibacteria bacterium]|nr:T9SS type A sorting domain-containing protein [Candidatus Latescibacterota bacterium]